MSEQGAQVRFTQGSRESIIETPVVRYNFEAYELAMHFLNTRLRLYGDTRYDYTEHFSEGAEADEAKTRHELVLPDLMFERMMTEQFPWRFYKDEQSEKAWEANQIVHDKEDAVDIDTTVGSLNLRRTNTRLRLFGEPRYNHIEFKTAQGQIRGLKAADWLMGYLFRHEFPIDFLPTVEMDLGTKQWFETNAEQLG